jgi:hypothetical protein
MLVSASRCRAIGVLAVLGTVLGLSSAEAARSAYDDAIGRALRLLPRQPKDVVLVERSEELSVHPGKPRAEAFVNQGGRVVYLVRQGVTLQAALKGPGIFDYVLAIIIWHEMAHIDGADEAAAQRAEEQLWTQFVAAQRVDPARGIRYLALLKKRR